MKYKLGKTIWTIQIPGFPENFWKTDDLKSLDFSLTERQLRLMGAEEVKEEEVQEIKLLEKHRKIGLSYTNDEYRLRERINEIIVAVNTLSRQMKENK